jgi:adenosylcobinamide kinase / adenosylcobinamide-phosphate guanylyltransferase
VAKLTLILGGARSGKSDFAERLARASARPVLFVATMLPGDDELRARVAAHRGTRPSDWRTLEAPAATVEATRREARAGDFVLMDCVTLLVSNILIDMLPEAEAASAGEVARANAAVDHQISELLVWSDEFDGEVALVSNEVGMGVVPAYPLGRAFRDALGGANRKLAAHADAVYLLAAGLALELKALGARTLESFGDGG